MKKILALILSIIMVMTVMAAIPALAEDEETVNLIVNGDFSADTAGADGYNAEGNVTEITGWTQLNEENKAILVARPDDNGNWIKAFNDSDGAYSGTELPHPAGVKQTVTIDTEKPWYTNYREYKYILTYDAHKAGSIWRGPVTVTVTGEDGVTETTDVTPVASEYPSNATSNGIKVDLSTAVAKIGRQPVKSIELSLAASGRWEYQTYGNISLTPVYTPIIEVENHLADGSFEEVATAEEPAWSFANGATVDSNLINDTDGSDGDYYVAVDAGQRIEQQADKTAVQAGKAYLIEFDYMAVEATGFISIESPATGYTKIAEPKLPATGTSWTDARWKTYQHMVVMRECDTEGLLLRLRNSEGTYNSIFYDNVIVSLVEGYDTTNMLANGDFEYGDETYISSWIQNGSVIMGKKAGFVNSGSFSAVSEGYGALQQWIYIDPAYEDSSFDLSFYFNYSSGGGGMPSILVRAYREDNSFTAYSYTACIDMNNDGVLDAAAGDRGCVAENQAYADGLHWTVRQNKFYGTINLDKALSKDTDERPVKRLLIQLQTANLGGTYDSVRLVPRKTEIRFANKDNSVPSAISEIKDDKLTATVKYVGESENAKAYFAVYGIYGGELMLESINVVTLTNGTEVKADLSGMGLTAEQHVVKAFIWDGSTTPVMLKTLE